MLSKLKIKNNYIFKKTPCFVINLDQNFDKKINLKKLVKTKIENFTLLNDFKIKIILSKGMVFNIIDDLFDLEIFNSKLEFTLNENSKLNYLLKTDSLKKCKDFCGDCFNCKKVEKIEKKLNFNFVGMGSQGDIKILLNGAGNYSFYFKTNQNHLASNTKSNLVIKSALSQNSNLKSDNLIKVVKNLKKVEAKQINKNLLLGYFSKALCIPKLEVESEDVICKHGAAVSKLNEELMFYLQSRGLNYCDAKQILIDAFLN
ncbi:hypothetical protein GF385_02515 [Candidatus Dependentiae bacterium]|nr:hypothetical protein [Candidatus Dependentiae bacterium]